LGGLGATYDIRLRLIGKRVVDFLLVLNELFSLGVTAEALRTNIRSKSAILLQRGSVDPKFQVEGLPPQTILFFSENYRLNVLSYSITRSSATAKSTARPSCLVGVLYDI